MALAWWLAAVFQELKQLMGRGLTARPQMCSEHPHRPASDRCDRCFHRFCPECFVRAGPQLLCQSCYGTDAAPDAGLRPQLVGARGGWWAVAAVPLPVRIAAALVAVLLLANGAVAGGPRLLLGAAGAATKTVLL